MASGPPFAEAGAGDGAHSRQQPAALSRRVADQGGDDSDDNLVFVDENAPSSRGSMAQRIARRAPAPIVVHQASPPRQSRAVAKRPSATRTPSKDAVVERTKSPTGSKDAVIERVVSRQSIAEQQHVQRQSSGSHTPPAMKGAAASRASPQSPQTAPTSPQTSASSPAVARAPAGEKQKPGQEEGEFTIVLKKSSPDESLGADIAGTPDTKALKIVSWKGDSLIEKWNSDNPAKQVKKGDLVVAANGMEGSVVTIIAEIKRSMVIELRIKRELVSAKAAGSAASSASSSSGAAAPGKGAGPPPAASDQEASESAESSAKEEGSDEEDDEEDSDSEESASEGK
ncbi:unnamed protein product, partial [Prorocentrum cordatum]